MGYLFSCQIQVNPASETFGIVIPVCAKSALTPPKLSNVTKTIGNYQVMLFNNYQVIMTSSTKMIIAYFILFLINHPNEYTFFYKQPHFRVEPRVAIKIPKMRLEVAMKLLSIFAIEAQGC